MTTDSRTRRPGRSQPADPARARSAERVDGYAPLRSYAAVGDGRSVALVAADGAIDWLAWPDLDSPSVLGALLDAERGGAFTLAPTEPFRATRRYLPATNVLETTFVTARGSVRVLDALTLPGRDLAPARELQRRVEAVTGRVPMTWEVRPRFGYGQRRTELATRGGAVVVATAPGDAVAVVSFGAGAPRLTGAAPGADVPRAGASRGTGASGAGGSVRGTFVAEPGATAVLALCGAHGEPLVLPARGELDARFAETVTTWRRWTRRRGYHGPWREAVMRSALVLKLLVHAPSGAVAAAATTSLPEDLGGVRNWDYRFSWVRDAAFTVSALLDLGCAPEARAYFWWLMQATQLTHPRLRPLYRLDGGAETPERILPLAGYRGSRPVRVGNAAAEQQQVDVYGELVQTVWLYVRGGGPLDRDIGRRVAEVADLVCDLWARPDAGIWEVRGAPAQFTHSKMMCWVALDRAVRLADVGLVPARHASRWRAAAAACRAFIEERCYSAAKGSYTRAADVDDLDASVLLGLLSGYGDDGADRWRTTVDALRRELGRGPYLYRYRGADGLPGAEGAFLACSFWLAQALARTGRPGEATALMDELVDLANDVGLYTEEIDPATGDFLGNLPQGLTHLALIGAAVAISRAAGPEPATGPGCVGGAG